MLEFSFIDSGTKDFVRNHSGKTLIKNFRNWDDADDFIMRGGLDEYGWTNTGTRKWCWNDEDEDNPTKIKKRL